MSWITSGASARLLEQSTDVAIEVHAGTLPQLFDMAALATMALQLLPLESVASDQASLRAELQSLGAWQAPKPLDFSGHDCGVLLVHWLRELSFLLESERFLYTGSEFRELGPALAALVSGVRARTAPVRELKGVTYHELVVSPVGDEWVARISYDL